MLESWSRERLEQRLRVFLDAGMLSDIPTPWQILQGTVEGMLFVVSSDAVLESRYRGAPFAHPFLRQPLLLLASGRDHARVGPAFDAKFESVCKHLYLTYHWGMPVFDLQVLQTHPDGLARFRARTEELLAGRTRWGRFMRRYQALILPRGDAYLREFLGEDGWIARAERLDYPAPETETSNLPPEFFGLVDFLEHCLRFPATRAGFAWYRVPGRLLYLMARRFREGGSLNLIGAGRRRALLESGDVHA